MEIKLTLKSNNRTLEVGNDTSYKLVNIDGIDSGSLELNTVSNAQFDGSVVVSKRIQNRNISITVDYKGTNSQEVERQSLISFFNPKNKGLLIVNYGEVERAIEYEVEGFNCKLNSIFDTVSFTVDLLCPQPYWRDILESKINIAMWRGMFHFPLILPSTIIPHSGTDSTWKDLSGNLNNGLLTGFNFDSTSGWTTEGLKFDSDSYVTLPTLDMEKGTIQVNNQVATFDKNTDYKTTSANSNILSLNTTVDGIMDIEIGGNTLQNLFKLDIAIGGNETAGYWYYLNKHPITDLSSKTITLINNSPRRVQYGVRDLQDVFIRDEVVLPFSIKVVNLESNNRIYSCLGRTLDGWTEANKTELKGMILEGDWTNKGIPSYFEGIRSVGEGENLELVSCGKNLIDKSKFSHNIHWYVDGIPRTSNLYLEAKVSAKGGQKLRVKLDSKATWWAFVFFSNNTLVSNVNHSGYVANSGKEFSMTIPDGVTDVYFQLYNANGIEIVDIPYLQIEEGTIATPYEPYKEHKQPITLTNPLRGLPNNVRDVAKGNLVTKNVGKVVLDSSINPILASSMTNTLKFAIGITPNILYTNLYNLICDKFTTGLNILNYDEEGIRISSTASALYISIAKSKLTTPDVAGFKAWLQANPITVYYQLATPTIEQLSQALKLKSFSNGTLQVNTLIAPYLTAKYPITIGGSLASNVSRIDLSNPLIASGLVKNYRVYNKILTTEEVARANTVNYLKGPALLVDLNSAYKELNKTGIIMGLREPSLIVNALNTGNVESGMIIEFKALGTLANPSILNVETQEFFKVNKSMVAGETITVNTNVGAKKVIDNLNGVETNILNLIDLDSTFLQLNVGDNLLRYDADTNLNNLEINIYYNPFYLGV
ncbi:hypothetical protein GCM10008908_24760 [Clostridium subterminale]|uniref:Phage tail protein n=1 Tax=Clostridium subterminale TaxID=1550 RepID=A0ABP3W434_CLOSU